MPRARDVESEILGQYLMFTDQVGNSDTTSEDTVPNPRTDSFICEFYSRLFTYILGFPITLNVGTSLNVVLGTWKLWNLESFERGNVSKGIHRFNVVTRLLFSQLLVWEIVSI